MAELEGLALTIHCPRCAAPEDVWCRTRTGKRATSLHAGRTWPVIQAWSRGYLEGRRDG